jgi:hypothetical protein
MKKLLFLSLIVFLLLAATPCTSLAQEAISASYSTEVEFPTSITFNISAESADNITQVILNYKINMITNVTVTTEVKPEFKAAPSVQTSWEWDTQQQSLPPGAEIRYSWKIEDAAGHKFEMPWTTVKFEDKRYHWKNLAEGKISLFWYKGDQSFAQDLLDTANEALNTLSRDTGASLEQAVEIYIYASPEDLRGALINAQEWTGGVSFSEFGILAIGIAPANLAWGERAMAHEVAHLVTYQMTYNPYSDIPTWLNEGLSMYAEGPLDPTFQSLLDRAISEDTLISVQSISSNFPASATEAELSYAESYSLVEFLITTYGRDKMLSLLSVFKQGSTYDNALQEVYGFDTKGLDNLWRQSLGLGPREEAPTPQPTHKIDFLGCHAASATTSHDSAAGLGILGIFLLPVIGEIIRVRAQRGKR